MGSLSPSFLSRPSQNPGVVRAVSEPWSEVRVLEFELETYRLVNVKKALLASVVSKRKLIRR